MFQEWNYLINVFHNLIRSQWKVIFDRGKASHWMFNFVFFEFIILLLKYEEKKKMKEAKEGIFVNIETIFLSNLDISRLINVLLISRNRTEIAFYLN